MGMSKRARLRQIHRWLEARFPCPRPTVLRFVRDPAVLEAGWTSYAQGDPDVLLCVNTAYNQHECIMALIEEHAHAEVIARTAQHTDPWALAYGRRRHAFDDKGGAGDSRSY